MLRLGLLIGLMAVGAITVNAPARAEDTTIKCTCTCKDSVGTWKSSCYSTDQCSTCCGYVGASAVLRKPMTEFRESTRGRVAPVAVKVDIPARINTPAKVDTPAKIDAPAKAGQSR